MSNRRRTILIAIIAVLLLAWPLGRSMMFVIDPREQAVVLQFGEPVRTCQEPGLYFIVPFIQEVRRLPRTYQFWTMAGGNILKDVQTSDGKKIEVTPWAIWKITDPGVFIEKLQTVSAGSARVKTFVRGQMRDVITKNKLAEVVRDDTQRKMQYPLLGDLLKSMEEASDQDETSQGQSAAPEEEASSESILSQLEIEKIEIGRRKLVEEIEEVVRKELAKADASGQPGRGIELVDVGIARIEFVPLVQEAAFQRQIRFREAIASWYTNRGEQLKKEILNQTNAEVQKIEGEGQEQSNVIKGDVEAEVIKNYAEAIEETGEFYSFIRTLEAYKEAVGSNTRLVLTTDSEMFGLLKTIPPAPSLPPSPAADEGVTDETPPDKTTNDEPAVEENASEEPPKAETEAEDSTAEESGTESGS